MVTIKIPFPIDVKLPNDKIDTVTFAKFIKDVLGMDKRAGANLKALLSVQEIIRAIDEACKDNKETVEIHNNDFDLMKQIIEAPEGGYLPLFALQLLPFIHAVSDGQRG